MPDIDLDDWEILAEPVQPDAAIEFWKDRAKLTWDNAKALADGARQRAFYIAGVGRQDLIDLVSDALKEALEQGETLEDFKQRILEAIKTQGWKDYRIETIFRTNMQSAYAAGRYKKMQEVKKSRPYWQYMSVMDKRTRPSHAILHEKIYPADHEFWDSNYPPNGFRCRCCVTTLSERQVKDQGLIVEKEMPKADMWTDPKTGMEYFVNFPGADKGFRNNPFKEWANGKISSDLAGKKMPQGWDYEKDRGNSVKWPNAVATWQELEKELIARCSQFATNNGVSSVVVKHTSDYFMATYSDGRFLLSEKEFILNNGKKFNPAHELKSAWNDLAQGKDLTWNEEYACESFWHEITHNRQKKSYMPPGSTKQNIMEIVTQWTARRTYHELLEELGGKASHQKDIIENGLGYRISVSRFDMLLKALSLKDEDILRALQNIIQNKLTNEYADEVCAVLANLSGEKKTIIKRALSSIKDFKINYQAFLKQLGLSS